MQLNQNRTDSHLDNLIQQVIKIVDDKKEETDKQSNEKPVIKKSTKKNKKTKSKK